jgi:hypothetical protein
MLGEKMHNDQRHNQSTVPRLGDESFSVEITVDTDISFYKVLLEAVEETFSSLGEPVEEKIFCTLEKSFGLKRNEIPFRIEAFSDALEKIFGPGAMPLQISVIKRLHRKVASEYNWDAPQWIVSKLTFREYVNMVKKDFEQSNRKLGLLKP